MKKNYILLLLFSTLFGFGQIPTGYYNSATGTGYALKTQLKKIIDNVSDGLSPEYIAVDKGYGSGTSQSNNGLWSAYGTTDRDMGIGYENDNTIVDIYSENPTGVDPYNYNFNTASGSNNGQCGSYTGEGNCYNREHIIPKSYFGQAAPMVSDVQHIYPTDGKVNAEHNDFAYGKVNVASFTSQNGSKLGTALNSGYSAGFSGTVFEPIDEFKGDIARVYLYFATRYEDQMATFYTTYTAVDCRVMFDGSANKVFSATFLNILLTWNAQDPVSTKEIVRNNAAFNHQTNRNPYIDHPEYVTSIWGSPLATDSFDISSTNISVFPNPTNDHKINIQSDVTLDEIDLININGQLVQAIKKPVMSNNIFTLENLPQGFYFIKLTSDNQTITKKVVVN